MGGRARDAPMPGRYFWYRSIARAGPAARQRSQARRSCSVWGYCETVAPGDLAGKERAPGELRDPSYGGFRTLETTRGA